MQSRDIPTSAATLGPRPNVNTIKASLAPLRKGSPITSIGDELEIVLDGHPGAGTADGATKSQGSVREFLSNMDSSFERANVDLTKSKHTNASVNYSSFLSPRLSKELEGLPRHILQPTRPQNTGMDTVVRHLDPLHIDQDGKINSRSMSTDHSVSKASQLIPVTEDSQKPQALRERALGNSAPLKISESRSNESQTQIATLQDTGFSPEFVERAATQNSRNNVLPDLNRVAQAATKRAGVVRPPPTIINGLQATQPFSLEPLPFADADIPLPEPYNTSYPHPLVAYASPGVNRHTVQLSGYDTHLNDLAKKDPERAIGSILYDAGFRNLSSSVYLLFSLYFEGGNGNGIPESLWSKLESYNNNSRLPVGVAGVSPFARIDNSPPVLVAPRFLAVSQTHQPPQLSYREVNPITTDYTSERLEPRSAVKPKSSQSYNHAPRPVARQYDNHFLGLGVLTDVSRPLMVTEPDNLPLYGSSGCPAANVADPPRQNLSNARSYYPSPDDTWSVDAHFMSPYKAELCVTWAMQGMCHWQDMCQYAHGAQELRSNDMRDHSNTFAHATKLDRHSRNVVMGQPRPQIGFNDLSAPADVAFFDPAISLPVPATSNTTLHSSNSFEPRRASCPASQLPVVPELEDDVPLPLPQRRQSDNVPAPIGAGRPLTSSMSSLVLTGLDIHGLGSMTTSSPVEVSGLSPSFLRYAAVDADTPLSPSAPRHPAPISYQEIVTPGQEPSLSTSASTSNLRSPHSTLSLSTSASSRYSFSTQHSEPSPELLPGNMPFSPMGLEVPIDHYDGDDPYSAYSRVRLWEEMGLAQQGTSASIEFSTGKSIWN